QDYGERARAGALFSGAEPAAGGARRAGSDEQAGAGGLCNNLQRRWADGPGQRLQDGHLAGAGRTRWRNIPDAARRRVSHARFANEGTEEVRAAGRKARAAVLEAVAPKDKYGTPQRAF